MTYTFHLTLPTVWVELLSRSQKAVSPTLKPVSILHNAAFPIKINNAKPLSYPPSRLTFKSQREILSHDPISSSLPFNKCCFSLFCKVLEYSSNTPAPSESFPNGTVL